MKAIRQYWFDVIWHETHRGIFKLFVSLFSTKNKEPKQLKTWFIADVSRNNLSHCQSFDNEIIYFSCILLKIISRSNIAPLFHYVLAVGLFLNLLKKRSSHFMQQDVNWLIIKNNLDFLYVTSASATMSPMKPRVAVYQICRNKLEL